MNILRKKKHIKELFPEEILIDSGNLADYSGDGEGKMTRWLDDRVFAVLAVGFVLVLLVFFGRATQLMALQGGEYRALSENNRLSHAPVFAERGVVRDRNGIELAWNMPYVHGDTTDIFFDRGYASTTGMAHVLGYVRIPARDTSGFLYRYAIEGVSGVEATYDDRQ
jgi:cell division protein FtsI/penicillin-binding protein 2